MFEAPLRSQRGQLFQRRRIAGCGLGIIRCLSVLAHCGIDKRLSLRTVKLAPADPSLPDNANAETMSTPGSRTTRSEITGLAPQREYPTEARCPLAIVMWSGNRPPYSPYLRIIPSKLIYLRYSSPHFYFTRKTNLHYYT